MNFKSNISKNKVNEFSEYLDCERPTKRMVPFKILVIFLNSFGESGLYGLSLITSNTKPAKGQLISKANSKLFI